MGSEKKKSGNMAGHYRLLKYIKFIYCQNALSPSQNTGQTIGACVKKAPSKWKASLLIGIKTF